MILTFPALLLAVFGYSAILEYKNKKAMNDEIQLHDGPQSEAQKKQGAYSAAQAGRTVSERLRQRANINRPSEPVELATAGKDGDARSVKLVAERCREIARVR